MKIDKIKFERTGGFAGIRLAAEIEDDDLPKEQWKELLDLLDDLDLEQLPGKTTPKSSAPDDFVYSIIVVAGRKEYRVLSGESAAPDEMQALVEKLEAIAKRQLRKK